MVDPVKIFLTSSLITMQNLVVISHTVCAHVKDPNIWGTLGPRPNRTGSANDRLETRYSSIYVITPNSVGVKPFGRR